MAVALNKFCAIGLGVTGLLVRLVLPLLRPWYRASQRKPHMQEPKHPARMHQRRPIPICLMPQAGKGKLRINCFPTIGLLHVNVLLPLL